MDAKKVLNTISMIAGIVGGLAKAGELSIALGQSAKAFKEARLEAKELENFDDDLTEDGVATEN